MNQIGLVGLGVMGRNLAWNLADHGLSVVAYNREPELVDEVLALRPGAIEPAADLAALADKLQPPRIILVMITAGRPVDLVLEALAPHLGRGDVVIDGGNSHFLDTRRREAWCAERGLDFVGMGVSGGEEGARHGPSLMPGGTPAAWQRLRPILEAIAARTEAGPCVTHVGPDGAGHFVKMVHNGIEYADMQLIAEAYDVLRRLGHLDPPALAEVFAGFDRGPLESFLIQITARIFTVADPRGDGWLIDQVLDQAGAKGTGRWTVETALELGVAIPSIAAALDARVISSDKAARVAAARLLPAPLPPPDAPPVPPRDELAALVHDALLGAKILAYAQGMALVGAASDRYGWAIDRRELARIWKGGCIIRARLLDRIMRAYERDSALPALTFDPAIGQTIAEVEPRWRRLVALALSHGIAVPAMSASLAWYDAHRTAELPQNLTQAQRDAFGAHTYRRKDAPGDAVHTDWLG